MKKFAITSLLLLLCIALFPAIALAETDAAEDGCSEISGSEASILFLMAAKTTEAQPEKVWNYFYTKLDGNEYGIAGLMGNLKAESGFLANNLQNTFETKLGYSDNDYTDAVDDGTYGDFITDKAGYGLAQWTFWSRKEALQNFAWSVDASIGNIDMQLDFLWKEMTEGYASLIAELKRTHSVAAATSAFMLQFERPGDQSEAAQNVRITMANQLYQQFAKGYHPLAHTAAVAATCTAEGNIEYWYCADCNKVFTAAGATEIEWSHLPVAALGHHYRKGVCVRCGEEDPDYVAPPDIHLPKQATYSPGQFWDVSTDQWFTTDVASAFELSLMKGKYPDMFDPYGEVSLAQAITLAARIHQIYATGWEHFPTVEGNQWYQVYADYAYAQGIIGSTLYTGNLNLPATRAQFSEIFANCLPEECFFPINTIPDGWIPDVYSSDSYYTSAYKLYRAGILTGKDSYNNFYPPAKITRAEAATIVSRMANSERRIYL